MDEKKKKIGVNLIWISIGLIIISPIFAHMETIYFGCNWMAQSKAEWICNMIAIGIMIAGVITAKIGMRMVDKYK